MTYLFQNYARKDFEIVSGQGVQVQDNFGKNYLDFTSGIGVVNLGHHHKAVEQALQDQARQIWHMPNLYENHLQEQVAQALVGDLGYLGFFCNSGAEANEAAIKLARKATGKSKVVSFINSFHGRTYGAMTATGQAAIHAGFIPLVPDFHYGDYNDFTSLELVDDKTACVMLELIQGEGGVLLADNTWVQALAQRCLETGALLVIDEVQTGMGRTGSLFAFQQFAIEPDIFTLAKGLGNGFPVGAMFGKKELGAAFGPGSHGTTFGGNKLAMAVALAVTETMEAPGFFEEVQETSRLMEKKLDAISSGKIQEIRGLGLMWGIELTSAEVLHETMKALEDQGLLTLRAGERVLRLLPALTITQEEMITGLEMIKGILAD
ncbi:acetylornithine transaminase [Enterococcus asini]|uniref:acetylornithine transaminase n=1 Tax=Enterococcus asini TaxID=57732 RepID=UPI00288E0BB6|nr:acetylornithine transaminase [Enterococcus asini]MDT2757588.1 acetylornithine transaminase [Enterococcus asini]